MFGGSEIAPPSKKMAAKTSAKTDAKNDAKIYLIWRPNGAKMEVKRHPKINGFLARFLEASGNIGVASGERRGSVEGASTVTLSAADPPGRRHIIKEYCRIINKDRKGLRI